MKRQAKKAMRGRFQFDNSTLGPDVMSTIVWHIIWQKWGSLWVMVTLMTLLWRTNRPSDHPEVSLIFDLWLWGWWVEGSAHTQMEISTNKAIYAHLWANYNHPHTDVKAFFLKLALHTCSSIGVWQCQWARWRPETPRGHWLGTADEGGFSFEKIINTCKQCVPISACDIVQTDVASVEVPLFTCLLLVCLTDKGLRKSCSLVILQGGTSADARSYFIWF